MHRCKPIPTSVHLHTRTHTRSLTSKLKRASVKKDTGMSPTAFAPFGRGFASEKALSVYFMSWMLMLFPARGGGREEGGLTKY